MIMNVHRYIWVFPKIGVPQIGWFIMEHPIKMDDLGVPLFSEPPYIYNPLRLPNNWKPPWLETRFTNPRIQVIQQKYPAIHWPSSMFNGESFFHQSHPDPFMTPGKVYVCVSKNNGTPKSSILTGFSIINHPFWGTSIFGNTHVGNCEKKNGENGDVLLLFIAEVRKISSANCLGASHVLRFYKMCKKRFKSDVWKSDEMVLWWQKGIDIADIQVSVEHYHSYNLRGGNFTGRNEESSLCSWWKAKDGKYTAHRYFTWRIATGRMQGFVPRCISCWK